MEEQVYRNMGAIGAGNIAVGVVMITVGVVCGILSIIGGVRLFKNQKNLTF